LTQSNRSKRALRTAQKPVRPSLGRRSGWLLLGAAIVGAALLRKSSARKGAQVSAGGATDEQIARIRETAETAQALPLP
jgi:hypothetical protein